MSVTSATFIVHSCHWLKCQRSRCCEQSTSKTRFRLDSDYSQNHNGSDSTVSAVNATHCTRCNSTPHSTQCGSQPKGDVSDQSES
eukprot:4315000-Amphidinium_carterae.1